RQSASRWRGSRLADASFSKDDRRLASRFPEAAPEILFRSAALGGLRAYRCRQGRLGVRPFRPIAVRASPRPSNGEKLTNASVRGSQFESPCSTTPSPRIGVISSRAE